MHKVLLFEPDTGLSGQIAEAMKTRARVVHKNSSTAFLKELDKTQYDLVFVHLDFSDQKWGEFLQNIHVKNPFLPIIITSLEEKVEHVVAAMNGGACDYLVYPVSEARAVVAYEKAIQLRDQSHEIAYLRRKQDVVYSFDDIVAESVIMKDILRKLQRFAHADSTMLITGDTGTGKSFLSGTVHFNSPRKKKPFVKINCANIPEDLLESELFGHVKGAFTGADKLRVGRFEQANGGTIFLDEIGEINSRLQTKLLRVLEEKSFERVGGNKTIYSDVRIIAATNKNLVEQTEKGLFREDLYYRINVLPIKLPSLKERPKCVIPLAEKLLRKVCTSMHKDVRGFSASTIKLIETYDWPGNIRQLANTIERAVILEDDYIIHAENISLPLSSKTRTITSKVKGGIEEEHLAKEKTTELAEVEKELIKHALEDCLWVQKNAAEKLGISPRAMNYKIKKYGITHPHWRANKE